jgi:urea carboxylase
VLDLNLRFRVHALMQWLESQQIKGIIDLTPGIRSLQVHFESLVLPVKQLASHFANMGNPNYLRLRTW